MLCSSSLWARDCQLGSGDRILWGRGRISSSSKVRHNWRLVVIQFVFVPNRIFHHRKSQRFLFVLSVRPKRRRCCYFCVVFRWISQFGKCNITYVLVIYKKLHQLKINPFELLFKWNKIYISAVISDVKIFLNWKWKLYTIEQGDDVTFTSNI